MAQIMQPLRAKKNCNPLAFHSPKKKILTLFSYGKWFDFTHNFLLFQIIGLILFLTGFFFVRKIICYFYNPLVNYKLTEKLKTLTNLLKKSVKTKIFLKNTFISNYV